MSRPVPARGHTLKVARAPVNRCFVCGPANRQGMRLKFYFDKRGRRAFCRFRLARRYQGPPGHAHGGIIATILDEAMGKVNKLRAVVALTSQMRIEYLKPVPLGQPLMAVGRERSVRGRRHTNRAEIRNRRNQVLARGEAVFIAIDPEKMFAKHLPRQQRRMPAAPRR